MDWGIFWTMFASVATTIGFVYQIMRNFKDDVNKKLNEMDKKFELHERRFEKIDQRLFLLCMGKSLPDILKSEREEEKVK